MSLALHSSLLRSRTARQGFCLLLQPLYTKAPFHYSKLSR
jgi:hypothetical protein